MGEQDSSMSCHEKGCRGSKKRTAGNSMKNHPSKMRAGDESSSKENIKSWRGDHHQQNTTGIMS